MSKDLELIRRDDASLAVEITEEAERIKEEALASAEFIVKVDDDQTNVMANDSMKTIKRVINQVEKARKSAVDPIRNFVTIINDRAKEFRGELDFEYSRLSGLTTDFQYREREKARIAEQKRREEEERLAKAKRDLEAAQAREEELKRQEEARQKAEADRLAKERSEAIEKAKNVAEVQAVQQTFDTKAEDATKKAAEELAKNEEEKAKALETIKSATAEVKSLSKVQPAKASGQRVREEWSIIVTDPLLLAQHHPDCVRIEPKLLEVKKLLEAGVKVHGVEAEKVLSSGVRLGPERKAIDV